ncbi:MAG: UbiA family prenyltransferase [Nitrososphaeraceae archaeon]
MNTQLVKSYLTLVRSPNLFTLPSNIFAGYFSVHTHNSIDIDTVVLLILVSASLYAAGVIFNDVADRKIDHKERHNRPIPSGKITLRNAVILGLLLIVISTVLGYFISATTFIVVVLLIVLIFLYDFVLKNSFFGPVVMGSTRVLNVVLGASTNLSFTEEENDYRIFLVCFSEFIYISGISVLSKYETIKIQLFRIGRLNAILFVSPLIIGAYAAVTGLFNDYTWIYLFIFGSFILSILRVISSAKSAMTNSILQKIIGLLITGVIIHDAIYIGGSLNSWYAGISIFVLLVPTMLMGKKFYVT